MEEKDIVYYDEKIESGIVITHGGIFHADDVFATALIQYFAYFNGFGDLQVRRQFSVTEEEKEKYIVYDIGDTEFDHHHGELEKREDGTPYAAFGKMWRIFGTYIVGEEAAQAIDNKLVKFIDNTDNGGDPNPLSSVIHGFNPEWDEDDKNTDECFFAAVDFAYRIIEREIMIAVSTLKAVEIIDNAVVKRNDKEILILDKYVPYISRVQKKYPEICFVIYPSIRGGYNCQTVPKEGEKQGKILFPQEWLGKTNEILGITFCHIGNWLLSTETEEQAINCAKIALQRNRCDHMSSLLLVDSETYQCAFCGKKFKLMEV